MGNRSSSVQPAGPPALLSAAVMGDLSKFQQVWTGSESIRVLDRQHNNALHALFSCRGMAGAQCPEILNHIHASLSKTELQDTYHARNDLGCTPLWILVAYGNVTLLKDVQEKLAATNSNDDEAATSFKEMLRVSNNQGDSPFLATCSMGNTDMVRFLKEEILTPEQFANALTEANKKGTTPLQIIVGNSHLDLLQYVLQEGESSSLEKQLKEFNAAGLSLFHICSERNAHEALQALLTFVMDNNKNKSDVEALEQVLSLKDKNGASALHVAAFCGNQETVQLWIDVCEKACANDDKANAVKLLDKMDGQARTPYWLAMVQGRDAIGQLLAATGVDTQHPNMVKEIKEAREQRQARQQQQQRGSRPVDGSALFGAS